VDEENVAQLGVVVVTGLRLPELRPLVCLSVLSLMDRDIMMPDHIVATSDHPSDVAAVVTGIPSLPDTTVA
jgi:hypothetical protein